MKITGRKENLKCVLGGGGEVTRMKIQILKKRKKKKKIFQKLYHQIYHSKPNTSIISFIANITGKKFPETVI